MKIRNYLTILFSIIAIFFLLLLAGYMTYLNASEDNPVRQAVSQVIELLPFELPLAEQAATEPETETEAPSELQTETQAETAAAAAEARNVPEHSLIFVGDSRTVSMGEAVNDSCTYLGESGEGYRWFSETGSVTLRTLLESNPKQTVIYNLGINDPENINVYIDLYESLAREFSDTSFYYMSVNPLSGDVSSDADFNTTNEMIELFNKTLKSAFPDQYLDTYSWMEENGFETVDGLHYTEDTSISLHDYVVSLVA